MLFIGIPADKVGADAGEMLLNQLCHGGCVDDFLQDQVVGRESDTIIFLRFRTNAPKQTVQTQIRPHVLKAFCYCRPIWSNFRIVTAICLVCKNLGLSFAVSLKIWDTPIVVEIFLKFE